MESSNISILEDYTCKNVIDKQVIRNENKLNTVS